MRLFDKLKEPVFLKESSDAQRQLEVLKELESKLVPEGQEKIRQDIKYLEYGIQGENQIAFELKNSHMPMYILHDLYLEDGELSAQIDYLVVTRKLCFVIECKNLYGNIEINNTGDFIRSMEFGGRKKKEGIYSPITQNMRHLELLKKLKTESRGNAFSKFMTARYFEDFYKSIVVLANPKTVLNARYAKKEVKDKVIRADQLVAYIKEQYRQSKEDEDSDERLKSWAESFLKLHKETEKDYTEKYRPYLKQTQKTGEWQRARDGQEARGGQEARDGQETGDGQEARGGQETRDGQEARGGQKTGDGREMRGGQEADDRPEVEDSQETRAGQKMRDGQETGYGREMRDGQGTKDRPEAKGSQETRDGQKTEDGREIRDCQETKGRPEPGEILTEEKIEDTPLYKELKAYRLRRSREEQIKPYFIFNNNQLNDLIDRKPENKQELQKVSGFGPVKAEKYGDEVLEIISRYK